MAESTIQDKEELKRKNTACFIIAANELIREEGLEKLSVRKIAERAGFHNSTIYLYFKDLDQLTMLASVKHFQEYSHSLSLLSKKALPEKKNFMAIWSFFMDAALKNPKVFYNFFFGRRSGNLEEIMNTYYSVFPEEREDFSLDIESMYFGKNIFVRSRVHMASLIGKGTLVTEENLDLLNEMTVCYCQSKLHQKCQNPDADSAQLKSDVLHALMYVTGITENDL